MFRPDRKSTLPAVFSRLLIAWASSLTADGIRFAAVPLLALTTDPSPAAVSTVAAATALPWLLVALPAGALVDRCNPAKVIAVANAGRAAATSLLVLAIITGRVDILLLCVLGFALTAGETFADSAAQSMLVRIVPSSQLERANARFVSSENVGLDLIGPLLAGALFAVASWLPFTVSAAVFVTSSLLTLTLSGHRDDRESLVALMPTKARGAAGAQQRESMSAAPRPSFRDGFRVVFADVALRTLVITVAVMAGCIAAAEGLLVIYSTSSLHLSESLYPTLLAAYTVGVLVSAALVGRLGRDVPGVMMLASIALIAATLIVLGLLPHPVVAWCCFGLMGFAGGTWNTLSATRRQRRTPRAMTARVSSTFRAIGWGALPIGTALGGLGGERWNVPAVFVISGAVVLILGCAVAPSFLRHDPVVPPAGGPDQRSPEFTPLTPGH